MSEEKQETKPANRRLVGKAFVVAGLLAGGALGAVNSLPDIIPPVGSQEWKSLEALSLVCSGILSVGFGLASFSQAHRSDPDSLNTWADVMMVFGRGALVGGVLGACLIPAFGLVIPVVIPAIGGAAAGAGAGYAAESLMDKVRGMRAKKQMGLG